MSFLRVLWDSEDDPDGNVEHVLQHGVSPDDVEHVLSHAQSEGYSRSTGLPVAWGYTLDGRYVIVVYDRIDEDTIRVITAYEVPEPEDGG